MPLRPRRGSGEGWARRAGSEPGRTRGCTRVSQGASCLAAHPLSETPLRVPAGGDQLLLPWTAHPHAEAHFFIAGALGRGASALSAPSPSVMGGLQTACVALGRLSRWREVTTGWRCPGPPWPALPSEALGAASWRRGVFSAGPGPRRSSPRHWHAVGPLCPPLCSCDLGGCRQGHGEATEELHCFSHCEPRVLWSAVRSPLVPGERVCPSVHVQVGPLEVWGDCLLFSPPVAGGNSRGFL